MSIAKLNKMKGRNWELIPLDFLNCFESLQICVK